MTQDELLNFIHAASLDNHWHYYLNGKKKISKRKMESLERFAKLIADRERKKCVEAIKERCEI